MTYDINITFRDSAMPMFFFIWSSTTVEHLAEHDVSPDEFEFVVQNPESTGVSRSTGRPFAVAVTDEGRELLCVYEQIDAMTIEPITAYELD